MTTSLKKNNWKLNLQWEKDIIVIFRKLLVNYLRDKGIAFADGLLNNMAKAPNLQNLQLGLSKLDDSKKRSS